MAENSERRYQDSLFPRISRAIDLGSWALRWRKIWSDDIELRTGTVTADPVAGADIVNKAYVDGAVLGTLTTVEAADGSPTYSPVDTLQFDEADGFVVTNPSAGTVRIDFVDPVVGITVREVDGTPSVATVTTLEFAQADGFVVSDQTGGVARVDLAAIPVTLLSGSLTDLGTTLTGTLPIADGGTAAATAAGARTNLDVPSNAEVILDTLIDAKGDLIAGTAADTPARVAVGTNRTILEADSAATPGVVWAARALGLKSMQVFTISGTWTRPTGIRRVLVEVVGGGGGGGGCPSAAAGTSSGSAGGGGSGAAVALLDVSAIASSTITVGGGGAGGAAGANDGVDGSASSWADGTNTVTGNGGGFGAAGGLTFTVRGGTGGSGSGGNFVVPGQGGGGGVSSGQSASAVAGAGGSSLVGGGAPPPNANVVGNASAANSGGGGSGAADNGTATARGGGAGGSGIVIVFEYE